MKFKKITPGMVIHCSSEEDARALLEHISNIGLMWPGVDYEMENYKRYGSNTCFSIRKNNAEWKIGYGHVRDCIEGGDTITEFSDLIEADFNAPNAQLSAVEVLEWLRDYTPEKIIDKITAYKAKKKVPKLVEVEYGWHCEIFDKEWHAVDEKEIWECDEEHVKDEAADREK